MWGAVRSHGSAQLQLSAPSESRIWPFNVKWTATTSKNSRFNVATLFFFFLPPPPRFQEHPGKSFGALYFHLSPGLLWTAQVIVRVNFRGLKGSNLKAFDCKCKLQLESCQVLPDGTWRDAATPGIPAAGTARCAPPQHSLRGQQEHNRLTAALWTYKFMHVIMWLGLGHLCESASECEESIPEFLFQYTLKGFLWDQSRAAEGIMSCRSTSFFFFWGEYVPLTGKSWKVQ